MTDNARKTGVVVEAHVPDVAGAGDRETYCPQGDTPTQPSKMVTPPLSRHTGRHTRAWRV
jgi:hypothetical protein